MGKLCSKKVQTITSNLIETEREIKVTPYKSKRDKEYELLENKYNYFRKLNFADYFYSLVIFSNENATLEDDYKKTNINYSMNESFFDDMFSEEIFQSFLENKILKHKSIYVDALNNEKVKIIFKEEFLAINNGLGIKLAQNAEGKGDPFADKNTIVKKGDAIAYGILYCCGANYIKIRALFNLFQENGQLKSSGKFSNFLLSLYIIPSYGMVNARHKLSKFDEIGGIEKEKLKELAKDCELVACQNMVEVTNKLIFGEDLSLSLSYETFKGLFQGEKDKSLAFMLSPSGVRYMLEKYNV